MVTTCGAALSPTTSRPREPLAGFLARLLTPYDGLYKGQVTGGGVGKTRRTT